MTWEYIYNFFGIEDFVYFISSPELQDKVWPVKLIFILCSLYFLAGVIYFMLKSSWVQNTFLEDVSEFFAWRSYGERQMDKQWERIRDRISTGTESDYKLAVIDVDDLLIETLERAGYEGDDFKSSINNASRLISPILNDVIEAHEVRNSIVYNPEFKLSIDQAKKILAVYESAIRGIGMV